MKALLISILASLVVLVNTEPQELTKQDVQEIYVLGLTEFLQKPIIQHKLDKKELVLMHNEDVDLPEKIHNIKLACVTGRMEVTDVMNGKRKKHNGRSIITISHKVVESGEVKLSIHQWTISNAEKAEYSLKPLSTNTKENRFVKNSYVVERRDNVWSIK